MAGADAAADRTVDAFHRGRFWLVQPSAGGHRAGIDALLIAAAVPAGFSGRVADFGAGAGAAGMAVAARCPEARVSLVERAPEMAAYARQGLALPQNREIAGRIDVLLADVTLAGRARAAAGLADRSFGFVIMNPPFNAPRDRATGEALRREAHVMQPGLFERWLRTAAAVLRPGGGVALIARPQDIAEILGALRGRFGGAEIVPIHPRPEAAAIRIVVRARRGSRAGLTLRPPLMLHGEGGEPSGKAVAISEGRAALFDD